MTKWQMPYKWITERKLKVSILDIACCVFFVALFAIFLLSWYESEIPIIGGKIKADFLKHWVPLITLFAFGITLYKQINLEGRLDVQKRAVISTNNKICSGLIDDINAIIGVYSNKTAYHAINLLRERIEIHLEYCQSCCNGEAKQEYGNWALSLNRYEHQLRGKIKSAQVNFDDNKFVSDMREFKRFLIQKDNLIIT